MRASAASRREETSALSMSGRVLMSVTGMPRIVRPSGRSAPARRRKVFSVSNTLIVPFPRVSGLRIPPDRSRRTASILVKLHCAWHLRFGDENHLPEVKREMLYDLVNRFEDGHVAA